MQGYSTARFVSVLKIVIVKLTLELDIKLDSGFKEFYAWCKSNDIPVIIVSRFVVVCDRVISTI